MNTFLGILTLGFIILIHEWGHYIAARLCKVRVDVFSIGFGPRLFGIKRGDTDWRLSAVPLGGYVRMAGQDITDIDSSADSKPTGAPDELLSKTRYQRAFISFAGPAVNLIFPLFLLALFYGAFGVPVEKFLFQPIVVAGLSGSQQANPNSLHNGDRILSINGVDNATWETAQTALEHAAPGSVVNVEVSRDGEKRNVTVSLPSGSALSAVTPFGYLPVSATVGETVSGYPADVGGVRDGDVIRSVDGHPIEYWEQFVGLVRSSGGKPLEITVDRKGHSPSVWATFVGLLRGSEAKARLDAEAKDQQLTLSITPTEAAGEGAEKYFQIGIQRDFQFSFRHVGFAAAGKLAGRETVAYVTQTIDVVGRLLSGRVSVKQLQSVIGISRTAGQAVSRGPFFIISFMALISVNLGILNLLPIPILDGGHILLLSLEGIRRRDFSLAFKERFIQVGLVFLLVLIAYVMYNDVGRLLHIHS